MAYNRAQGYSDFYKNSDQSDNNSDEGYGVNVSISMPHGMNADDKRKAALRRRLMKRKAGK